MRRLVRRSMLIPAAVLAGCSGDRLTAPVPSPSALSLDRDAGRPTRTFQFTTIDVPGSRSTSAWGINAGGDVVGEYFDAAGNRHGFVVRDGVFGTIDFPGALVTSARGISPGGDIVGLYRYPGEPPVNAHGFRLTPNGDFVTVDFPGHTNTIPQRILPDGTILGCRHDNDTMGSMRGIAIARDGNSEVSVFASMNNGATPDLRRIVGLWTNMMAQGGARQEGYIIDDGEFTSFVVPGSNLTAAWDMNPAGDIVGNYRTGAGSQADPFVVHGFIRTDRNAHGGGDAEYVSVDVPGATSTQTVGINARGDIVGSYVRGGKTYGYIATSR